MASLAHRARNTDRFELNRNSWQAAGLVGWWPFGAYPDARNMSPYGQHLNTNLYWSGASAKGPERGAAEGRTGMTFDGSNDWMTVADYPQLNNLANFTATFWIRFTTTGNHAAAFSKDGNYGFNFQFFKSTFWGFTGSVYVEFGAASQAFGGVNETPSEGWTANEWIHYAMVFNDPDADGTGSVAIYKNGIALTAGGSVTGAIPTSMDSRLFFGAFAGNHDGTPDANYYLGGLLDDVRMWNRALSVNQILAIYNQTRDGGYGDLAVLPTRRIGIDPLLFPPGGIIGTASVSPVTAAWSTPAVTATHSIVISASASPVTAAWSVPAVTATYATAPSASVSPVTAAWGVPAVTATRTAVFSASASPVTTTWSTPAVTATHATSHSASASPVAAAWSTTATTATYAVVIAASASPVTAAWSVPSMTATTSAVALPTVFYSTRGLSTVSMAALGTANAEAELVGAGGVSLLVKGK